MLRLIYENVITTPEVSMEFSEQLPDWIKIECVKDKKYQKFLETQLDLGEASAIALATELDNPLLLLDDLKARKLARKLELDFTGTLGIINKAKQIGAIDMVKPLIDKLISAYFRISNKLVNELLEMNNEMPATTNLEFKTRLSPKKERKS